MSNQITVVDRRNSYYYRSVLHVYGVRFPLPQGLECYRYGWWARGRRASR